MGFTRRKPTDGTVKPRSKGPLRSVEVTGLVLRAENHGQGHNLLWTKLFFGGVFFLATLIERESLTKCHLKKKTQYFLH